MNDQKTLENLMEAFAGESQANRKYVAYSKKAEADGKKNAAKLFKAASDAETFHAQKHFEVAGKIKSTVENLNDAVKGENHEYQSMYPEFLKAAQEEGNLQADQRRFSPLRPQGNRRFRRQADAEWLPPGDARRHFDLLGRHAGADAEGRDHRRRRKRSERNPESIYQWSGNQWRAL